MLQHRGDLAGAERLHRRSLAIGKRINPQGGVVARGLINLGTVLAARGDVVLAEDCYRSALAIFEKGSPTSAGVAVALENLADLALLKDDVDGAESLLRRALALAERARDAHNTAFILVSLGVVRTLCRRHEQSEDEGRHRCDQSHSNPHRVFRILTQVARRNRDAHAHTQQDGSKEAPKHDRGGG